MHAIEDGLDALRRAVWAALSPQPLPHLAGGILYAETAAPGSASSPARGDHGDRFGGPSGSPVGDEDQATSSELDGAERERLIALVELARQGDKEAFGLLYDHYQASVYRFLYY